MKITIKILFALSLSVLISCDTTKPLQVDVATEEITATLDKRLPPLIGKNMIPGISLGILRDGNQATFWSHGKGINENTVFEAASLGKPIFAYIALRCHEKGIINIDSPISDYPSAGQSFDPNTKLGHLLSHTSGLSNLGDKKPANPNHIPGVTFRYSGKGYQLLQSILEEQSGKSLPQLADELVYKPLKMDSSAFIWKTEFEPMLVQGHNSKGERTSKTDRYYEANAAYSFYTTTADYLKFVSIFLGAGDPVTNRMKNIEVGITREIAWSLGWGIQKTTPHPSIWHWGSNPGYRNYTVAYPTEKCAVVLFSNSDNTFTIVEEIFKNSLGGELPSYHWF